MNRNCLVSIALAGIAVGFGIAMIPPPEMLSQQAMIYLGIFACTMIYLVAGIIPEYVAVSLALSAFVLFKVADFRTVFAAYGQSLIVLLVGVFGLSIAVAKCGLLKRIGLWVMRFFPGHFQGQVLALFTMGIVISPLIPIQTAKVSIMAPFAASVSKEMGYSKGSRGAAGLFSAMYISCGVCGHAFLTGSGGVFIILSMLPESISSSVTWLGWLSYTCIWLFTVLIGSYLTIMLVYQPKEHYHLPPSFAKEAFRQLPPMSKQEKLTAFVLIATLLVWISQPLHRVDASLVALLALMILILLKVLDRSDFCSKIPWDNIVFIGGILTIADLITVLRIDVWIIELVEPLLQPLFLNITLMIPALCLLVYFVRFFVISQTAVFTIFFIILFPLAKQSGLSPWVIAFTLLSSLQVWNLSFHNINLIAAISATGGQMVQHRDVLPMSLAYMVICILGLLFSIPLWRFLGLM
jgi:DASS family divalent anion:Na+ symporter